VTLKFSVELIFAAFFLYRRKDLLMDMCIALFIFINTYRLIPLKQHNPPSFVSGSQVVTCVVELNGRYDIGCTTREKYWLVYVMNAVGFLRVALPMQRSRVSLRIREDRRKDTSSASTLTFPNICVITASKKRLCFQ
jgi:hypothetical protein